MNINDVAARALMMRQRSCKELAEYLKKKGFEPQEIEDTIKDFKANGYLSDERFCEEYMRYAFGKKWGKLRVFKELKSKGVSADIIEDTYEIFLQENSEAENDLPFTIVIETDEFERAMSVTSRIVSGYSDIDEKIKGRVARRLAGYGYSSSVIYRVLGELNNEL